MKLKDVYDLIDGVALVTLPNEHKIKYGNALLSEPTKEMLKMEVEKIEPFYSRSGLYKYGVIIHLKENN